MGATKKKSTAKTAKKTAAGTDPFKTRKSAAAPKADDIIMPPPDVAEAISAFRQASDQAKYFDGEATVHKNQVLDYARTEYVKRVLAGNKSGFKLQGDDALVMYVVQDSSAGFSDEELAEFAERWGEDAADELIVRDFASIRFNDKVLEAHYDEVVAALQSLPAEILDNLFKPMLMKARTGALDLARRYAKNSTELENLMRDLKIKNYIK